MSYAWWWENFVESSSPTGLLFVRASPRLEAFSTPSAASAQNQWFVRFSVNNVYSLPVIVPLTYLGDLASCWYWSKTPHKNYHLPSSILFLCKTELWRMHGISGRGRQELKYRLEVHQMGRFPWILLGWVTTVQQKSMWVATQEYAPSANTQFSM